MNKLAVSFLLFTLAQSIAWFQINGQFLWTSFKEHPVIVAFTLGGISSLIFLTAANYAVEHFNGLLWPIRFITFGTGMVAFSILTYVMMGESMNAKTLVSLLLSLAIICLQIFWK